MPGADLRPRAQALDLVERSVFRSDRVLLTGASGWFGRTMLALLWHARGPAWVEGHVLAGASATRSIDVLGCGPIAVRALDDGAVAAFAPTLLVNCAFPTRNRVADLGHERYVEVARGLTRDLLEWAAGPSVERAVTLSSGAAVPSAKFPRDLRVNPYGFLKAAEESAFLDLLGGLSRPGVVCRVWAVSGPHVQHPENYAFSQMIGQALRTGVVQIKATNRVIRSYTTVEDVLSVSLTLAARSRPVIDTGGVTVDMAALGQVVAEVLGARWIAAEPDVTATVDDYRSRSGDWAQVCAELAVPTLGLPEQVLATVPGLRDR